ncbi:MAG: hypothetical protein AB7Q17_09355 [Phycisphaerae bacterium]
MPIRKNSTLVVLCAGLLASASGVGFDLHRWVDGRPEVGFCEHECDSAHQTHAPPAPAPTHSHNDCPVCFAFVTAASALIAEPVVCRALLPPMEVADSRPLISVYSAPAHSPLQPRAPPVI